MNAATYVYVVRPEYFKELDLVLGKSSNRYVMQNLGKKIGGCDRWKTGWLAMNQMHLEGSHMA